MEWAHHVACVERYFKVSINKDEGKRTFGEACKARRTINVCGDLIQLDQVGSSSGFSEYE
jgi:hypothetical protein